MNYWRTRIKICGMTRAEDLSHAVQLGVDAIGLIFYPQSPRYVCIEKAAELLTKLPPFVAAVAVLVNPDESLVHRILTELPIQLLQFHGDESPEFCERFKKPFIKAIQVQNSDQVKKAMRDYKQAQALLLDTPSSSKRGGTGLSFDWGLIPKDLPKPFILSGGLNESNLEEALRQVHPYALDVNSGVESAPGLKDFIKMSQLMKRLGAFHE